MKKLISACAVILLLGAGCKLGPTIEPIETVTYDPSVEEPTAVMDINGPEAKANLITVNLTPGDLVSSPLAVTGEARGYWYFEASFPVKLLDANGNQLALQPAQAQSDWMTEDFVPYSVTLSFPPPATATGTLMLMKDNPSGLPENDDYLAIPVSF